MKNILYSFLLFFIFTTVASSQFLHDRFFHPLSGRFAIGVEGGATYTKSDFRKSEFDYIVRGTFDYFFPTVNYGAFGLRAFGGSGYLRGSGLATSTFPNIENHRTLIYFLGGGASFNYTMTEGIIPYLFLGASYLYFDPKDKDGNDLPLKGLNEFSPNQFMIVGEGGFRFMLGRDVSFNINAAFDFVPTDQLDGLPNALTSGTDKDVFFSFMGGFTYYFSGIKDTDNDGVRDRYDLCPDTPPNIKVDEDGCPVDGDKDNIPDYIDKCPHTPANIAVDEYGCPVDADKDGVPDYLDLCKDTPEGVRVDERGCPYDSDEDGIADYKDLCPNTPLGTEVNKWGCPLEEKVYKPPVEKTEFVLSGAINFEIGKSNLLPNAFPELEKIYKVMNEYPDTKWMIEGHTDNTGSYQLNKNLSLDRARSVYSYLVSKGVNANRLSIYGYGPDYPVADNSTETGRALNRRVVVKVMEEGEVITQKTDVPTDYSYNPAVERNIGSMVFTDGYRYCFQVSSWRNQSKAQSEANRLRNMGYNAFVVTANIPELDGTWFRVRVGYFTSLEETKRVRSEIMQ